MTFRSKLMQGATTALYMGPLLAGLAGFGWAMVPPFLSLFLMWLVILAPHQWPQQGADWLRADTWVSVLARFATQLLLVTVLFAIGRGIGGVLGHLPMFHPLLPLAVSFMAIPLTRLLQGSRSAPEVTKGPAAAPSARPEPARKADSGGPSANAAAANPA